MLIGYARISTEEGRPHDFSLRLGFSADGRLFRQLFSAENASEPFWMSLF